MYCSKCGAQLAEGVKFCSNCGNCVEVKNDNLGNIQNMNNYMTNNNLMNSNTTNNEMYSNSLNNSNLNNNVKKEKDYGLYSLICGICSIVFAGIIGIVLGIVSIFLRKKEQIKTQKGKIGKILGIIGIVLSVVYLFGIASLFKALFNFDDSNSEPNYSEQDNFEQDYSGENNTFEPGITKEYQSLGYMEYIMPESWQYDDSMSAQQQYKSYVFKYKDGKSMADIHAGSFMPKVSLDAIKKDITASGFVIANETKEILNGIEWYKITTKNYNLSNGNSYHNEFYAAVSKQNSNCYVFHFYVSNDLTSNELTNFNESVKYILNNATLYRYDE